MTVTQELNMDTITLLLVHEIDGGRMREEYNVLSLQILKTKQKAHQLLSFVIALMFCLL